LFGHLGGGTNGQAVILVDDGKQPFLVGTEFGQVVHLDAAVSEDLDRCRGKLVGNEYARHEVSSWKNVEGVAVLAVQVGDQTSAGRALSASRQGGLLGLEGPF